MAAFTAALGLFATVSADAMPVKRDGVWAQSYVDRAPDPAIRFGTLANGMRYAIQHNATPPGQMALRLVIGTGSLAEKPGEEGIAHYLEHMAFRGSTHVADGELMRGLQREGLAPGADSNAATSHESTVYQFDFPHGGAEQVKSGLDYLREIASDLTIDPKAVASERGVILSEERLRDGPPLRATRALLGFTMQGTLAPDRLPIGTIPSIEHATAPKLRAFYEAHYRPDNATVIVVGDVNVDQVEAQIRARFGDWHAKVPAPPPPALGRPVRRGETARIFSEPAAPTLTQVAWVRPYDDRADVAARSKSDFDRLMAEVILNQRFADLARRPDAKFIGAGLSESNVFGSANITSLGISAGADRQLGALRATVDELRRARRYGFTQAEYDRAIAELDAMTANAVAGAATRQTIQLANRMVRDVIDDEVTRSPAQDRDDYLAWKHTAGLTDVGRSFKDLFRGSGPLLFVAGPKPPAGGEAAVRAAYDSATHDAIARSAAANAGGWPYADFGPAGAVTSRREIADLGLTLVTFANGVTLSVKPTTFAKDEVLIDVSFGKGRLSLPRDLSHAYWLIGGSTFVDGGTGKLDASEIQRLTAGHVTGARLQIGDDAYALGGRTVPADLGLELQLLTAYVADPGFRPEAVTRVTDLMATYLPQIDASPAGVLGRDLPQLLHDGDMRWHSLTSAAQLAETKPADLPQMLKPALGGPIGMTIVGDVTVDEAIEKVAATFGALPLRPAWAAPSAAGVGFPAPNAKPVALTHEGRPDQARGLVAWAGPDFWTNSIDARALQVVAALIQQRLFDTIREKEGSTYSPSVISASSTTLPGYGYLEASVEMPPEKLQGFFDTLDSVLADLRAHPVSTDELDRARRPLIESRARDLQTNIFWLGALPLGQHDPREYDAIRSRVSGTSGVSAADVQRVAQTYLRPERAYRVTVKAKASGK